MKGRIIKRIVAVLIAICMSVNIIPTPMGGFVIEVEASVGLGSLTCAGFIEDTTRRNYIDIMMKHYINTNSKLVTTLDNGYCVVFMFEGGSDNYSTIPYQDAVYTTRTQAVVIVVKKDSNGNAYIDYYNESCSSIPDDANWTSGGSCDNCTTVLDGIYSMQTWNHTGPYAALNLYDATWSWYTPTPGSTGWGNYCSGINVHTRRSNYSGGQSAGYAQSAGCQLISYGENSGNGFNDFMKSVAGITWNPWEYPSFNTFASTGAFKGYYVLDRQLGLVSPSGVEYGSGSLATLYTKGDLDAITSFSTNARANANFSYLDKCSEYAAYCDIEVTLEGAPINSLPCSNDTDESKTLETAKKGERYVATGLFKNAYGNYWYRIQTKSGGTGYIYGGEVKYISQKTPDVTLKDATPPNGHLAGTGFYLNGTVKSTYNEITNVEAAVYEGFEKSGEKKIGGSESVSTRNYVIEGSKVDEDTWFNRISAGKYTYVIYASYRNYYAEGATTLKSNTGTLTLMEENFVTVSSSVSQNTCNHTYDITVIDSPSCTKDGHSIKSCPTCGVISNVTDAKLGHIQGASVKENEVTGVSYDSVVYCARCTTELSRTHIEVGQDSNNDNDNDNDNNDDNNNDNDNDNDNDNNDDNDNDNNDNTRIELEDSFLVSELKDYTYTGKALKQNVVLKDGNYTLIKDVDYTVKYLSNINAGTAQVIITGIGKYNECIIKEYNILPKKVTNVSISTQNSKYVYKGKEVKPAINVKIGKTKLVLNQDYKVTYKNNTKPGDAILTVKFINNYSGSTTRKYTITPNKVTLDKQKSFAAKKITLSWTQQKDVTGYEIYRSTKKNGDYTRVAIVNGNKNKYTDTKLKTGKTYYYRVRAYKVDGEHYIKGSFSSIRSAITKSGATKVKATSGYKQAVVSWKKVDGAEGYEIYMSTSKKGKYKKIATKKASVTQITRRKLSSGKTYYFKVRSYKKAVGKKIYSKYSNIQSIKVK
ncbi:MAG: hypothetical protein E7270_10940 [Lachnospiraceae bacterium]|nr:hypothetical protein [Lachnospiraceae bacterium]